MEQVIRNHFGLLRKSAFLLALITGAAALIPTFLQAEEPLEYDVKAAFLLNFTKFIEWPAEAFASSAAQISICVLGEDSFGSTLDQIVSGEAVNGRKVTVQRIKRPPPPRTCQILFVSKSEKEVAKTLSALGPGVLTVGERDTFIREGGMIAFVIEERRVRFDINQGAAEKAGLKLSSKLLSVARSVEK
jgi:YfiR/HmsC-like